MHILLFYLIFTSISLASPITILITISLLFHSFPIGCQILSALLSKLSPEKFAYFKKTLYFCNRLNHDYT